MDELPGPRYIMPMIVSGCQHCDEQQFQFPWVHYTISSVVMLDVFLRALLQDNILALKKYAYSRVHLV